MLRSILSVVVGYLVLAVLTMAIVVGLTAAFPEYRQAGEDEIPPPALPMALNMGLSILAAATGGFTTARIAQRAKFRHAAVLAALLLALGAAYAASYWNGVQPHWYLALLPLWGAGGALAGGWVGTLARL